MYKIKHHLRHENKVNDNKLLSYCEASRYMWNNKESLFPLCQTYKPTIILTKLKKKVDQHTGGKWLIHGTKRHKDNRLQSLAQQDFIQKIYI